MMTASRLLLRLRKILARPAVWRGCQISQYSAGSCVLNEQELSSTAVRRRPARQTLLTVIWPALVVVLLELGCVSACGQQRVLFDFENAALGKQFRAVGKIRAARQDVPPFDQPKPKMPASVPEGHGVHVQTPGQGGVYSRSGLVPGDWRAYQAISFWVYRGRQEAAAHPMSVCEVQILEADGKARSWRKLELSHTGWKQVTLPLKWFRWGSGRAFRWDRVDRVGVWFRDAGNLTLDQMVLRAGRLENSADISLADLSGLAFPRAQIHTITKVHREGFWLLCDSDQLDAQSLAKHLVQVRDQLLRDWPSLRDASADAVLIVFSKEANYRQFSPRLAQKLNASAQPPSSEGYTLHGVATSFWDPQKGSIRPVYAHELIHAMLTQYGRITDDGSWFQEGVANYYQLRFHPQNSLSRIVREGLTNASHRTAFSELCQGKPIPTTRYWQAATLIEMMLAQQKYRQHLGKLVAAFQRSGSTDLTPHLRPILATDWDGLTEDWKAYCRKKYQR